MAQMIFDHNEAFCLMLYVSDDGSGSEVLWNSRDGVTPFVITLKSGAQATHEQWGLDTYVPPELGKLLPVRRFVDLTPEIARPRAVDWVDRYWETHHGDVDVEGDALPSMKDMFSSKEKAIDYWVESWTETPGSPTIVDPPDSLIPA